MTGLSRLRVAALQLRQAARSRAYGSAAAAQLQYDYYDDDECDFHGEASESMLRLDSAGLPPRRGVQWVLMGDPGVKKHVYAEKLSKLLEVPHISMGNLLRQELSSRSAMYKQIANHVNEGKLVPEDVIFALLSKRLDEGHYRGESGFILDGIPRTRIQAEILDQIVDVDLVVNFKCSEDHVIKKNLEREVFSIRKEFLSMGDSRLSTPNAGASLEDYYGKQRKLLNFQVVGAPGETWQGLLAALHLQHMNAVRSSQKLTA